MANHFRGKDHRQYCDPEVWRRARRQSLQPLARLRHPRPGNSIARQHWHHPHQTSEPGNQQHSNGQHGNKHSAGNNLGYPVKNKFVRGRKRVGKTTGQMREVISEAFIYVQPPKDEQRGGEYQTRGDNPSHPIYFQCSGIAHGVLHGEFDTRKTVQLNVQIHIKPNTVCAIRSGKLYNPAAIQAAKKTQYFSRE